MPQALPLSLISLPYRPSPPTREIRKPLAQSSPSLRSSLSKTWKLQQVPQSPPGPAQALPSTPSPGFNGPALLETSDLLLRPPPHRPSGWHLGQSLPGGGAVRNESAAGLGRSAGCQDQPGPVAQASSC